MRRILLPTALATAVLLGSGMMPTAGRAPSLVATAAAQDYGQDYGQGYGQDYSQGYGQDYGPTDQQGYGPDYGQGYGPGQGPGYPPDNGPGYGPPPGYDYGAYDNGGYGNGGYDNAGYGAQDGAYMQFYDALAPYGQWVISARWGHVWFPTGMRPGWRPYSDGHWVYTDDYGWTWVSDYEWGWAPFHYGRWVYIAGTGWAWIPGRRYAGAWVVWHTGPVGYGYVGWAPMPPEWYWYGGTAVVLAYRPYPRYHYCHTQYFFDRRVHEHMVPMASTPQIAANMSTGEMFGRVTNRIRCHGFTPSSAAASYCSFGTSSRLARKMIIRSPTPHRPSSTSDGLDSCGSLNHSGCGRPRAPRIWFTGPVAGLKRNTNASTPATGGTRAGR